MNNPKKLFTHEEQTRIEQAVTAAESKSSGEIVPMILSASSRYTEIELVGTTLGLVAGTLIGFIWHDPWEPFRVSLFGPLIGALLGQIAFSLPFVKRSLLPTRHVNEALHLRSLAAFAGNGLHHTKNHTGILIFVSLLERRVVILADRGINDKVASGTWEDAISTMTDGLKSGTPADGFCRTIERCGNALAAHFPRQDDDQNELSDQLVTNK